ncbi:hypothetical protein [Arcanobacterium phocae]|uniref:hypothetical protein n=1 Tax=Arcanobacterium phocae TaxID=131112 RepID=UPI001C0ED5E7|nr:hypothetical protein [Arcanobacterium phocae]
MFSSSEKLLSALCSTQNLIILDLTAFTSEDRKFIKNNLPQIFDGRTTKRNIPAAAKYMLNLLEKWTEGQVHGAIAEFILICILRHHGYEQEYCFRNLEQHSLKKGFDGLYLDSAKEMWLSESKSSYKHIEHKRNLTLGYKQIQDNVTGKAPSDAWGNAYNHSRTVNADDSLQSKLCKLSDDYISGNFTHIEQYNVVLCSTVYTPDISSVERNKEAVEKWISSHKSKKELAVIVTTESIGMVIDLLKEIADE